MSFTDDYLDVLQNIEAVIIAVYKDNSTLKDREVIEALEELIQYYRYMDKGKERKPHNLSGLTKDVYDSVKEICDFRLGFDENGGLEINGLGMKISIEDGLEISVIVKCLRKILNSAEYWNRQGIRGYLNYVEQFIDGIY